MATRRPRRTHMFVDDPEMQDPRTGEQYCFCGLPASNEVHSLVGRDEDERAVEARRMGEGA